MPSDQDFIRVGQLAATLAAEGGHPFLRWLTARSAGSRAQAGEALAEFIETAQSWPASDRRGFILWLEEASSHFDDGGTITPHPLMARVVLPTLRSWALEEPGSPDPHLLSAKLHDWTLDPTHPEVHYRRALALDADLQPARIGVIECLLDAVERSLHCLPANAPRKCPAALARLDEVCELAGGLSDATLVARISQRVDALRGQAAGSSEGEQRPIYPFRG